MLSISSGQVTDWERRFANHVCDKGSISRTYKELSELHSKRTNSPVRTWARDLRWRFTKEDVCVRGKSARGQMFNHQWLGYNVCFICVVAAPVCCFTNAHLIQCLVNGRRTPWTTSRGGDTRMLFDRGILWMLISPYCRKSFPAGGETILLLAVTVALPKHTCTRMS